VGIIIYLGSRPKLCLDPGHGGYDPGACGNGLQEKDLTLDICLRIKPLAEYCGIDVVLTRSGDYAPGHFEGDLNKELGERCRIANDSKVDAMMSVHINAGAGGEGEEILIQGSGGRAGDFANIMLPLLSAVGGWRSRGVKVQNVEVLRETDMPAILTENGFINNVGDTDRLRDPNFRQALAVAHTKGLCQIFNLPYKEKGAVTLDTIKSIVSIAPGVTSISPDDIYLCVRVTKDKAPQAILDINKLGFACKVLPLC